MLGQRLESERMWHEVPGTLIGEGGDGIMG